MVPEDPNVPGPYERPPTRHHTRVYAHSEHAYCTVAALGTLDAPAITRGLLVMWLKPHYRVYAEEVARLVVVRAERDLVRLIGQCQPLVA